MRQNGVLPTGLSCHCVEKIFLSRVGLTHYPVPKMWYAGSRSFLVTNSCIHKLRSGGTLGVAVGVVGVGIGVIGVGSGVGFGIGAVGDVGVGVGAVVDGAVGVGVGAARC